MTYVTSPHGVVDDDEREENRKKAKIGIGASRRE